jgi:hypothetical protein
MISKTKRGAFNDVIGELRYDQDGEPTEGEGVEQLQGGTKEAYVVRVEEQCLPYIDAVGEYAYVRNGA